MTNRRYERSLAIFLFLWLVCCFKANAQVLVSPVSTPRYVPLDTNGNTLPGGKVCTFQAGTTTPLTSYSESTGSSANTNPVTLDSAGAANIWVQSQAYKIIVYSSVGADSNCPNAGVQQFSIDGINPGALGNTAITGTLSVSGAVTLSSTLAVTTSISVAGGTALTTTNSTGTGSLVKATAPTLTSPILTTPASTGTETHSGQIQSSLAIGTSPFSITSTTPVANLAATPTTYNAAGTQQANTHIVVDKCTLGTNCAVTLAGSAAFSLSTSYQCAASDGSAANAVLVNITAANAVTFTGTGTDLVRYICVGN